MNVGGARISVTVEDADVELALAVLAEAVQPVMTATFLSAEVRPYLQDQAQENFDEERSVLGGWKPLAPYTVDLRESMGYGAEGPINRRTGELEQFVTAGSVDPPRILTEASELTFPGPAGGELEHKLEMAQKGGPNPTPGFRPTPPRPVADLDEGDVAAVLVALSTWITVAVNARGFTPVMGAS